PPVFARHDEAEVARVAAAARVRAGPRGNRCVVQAERAVVAADQGPGRGIPEVLPGAVRQPHLTVPVAGLPLITGATGFAGGHLLERLVTDGGRVHAWGHKGVPLHHASTSVTWTAVDMLDR